MFRHLLKPTGTSTAPKMKSTVSYGHLMSPTDTKNIKLFLRLPHRHSALNTLSNP